MSSEENFTPAPVPNEKDAAYEIIAVVLSTSTDRKIGRESERERERQSKEMRLKASAYSV